MDVKMELYVLIIVIINIINVYCYPFSEGDIRLVGGRAKSEGTVLIFHENRWGAVCDYNWDIQDAHVACRQLGYPRALQHIHGSRFGRGRRRVWLVDVYCRGSESSLSECYHPGWGRLYRRHHSACRGQKHSAGIVCLDIETQAPTTLPPTISNDIFDPSWNEDQIDNQISDPQDILMGDEANNIPIRLPPETTIKTTAQPTTTKTTTPKPTTKSTTTTTQKPTTKSTTTTTQKPITTPFDRAADLPMLRVNAWIKDTDLKMWVLLLRNEQYLVAVPGRTPKRMTKEQYIKLRREKIAPLTTTTTTVKTTTKQATTTVPIPRSERMKADDPAIHSSGIVLDEPVVETTGTSADIQIKVEDDKKDDIDEDVEDMIEGKDDENDVDNNLDNTENRQQDNIHLYRNATISLQRTNPVARLSTIVRTAPPRKTTTTSPSRTTTTTPRTTTTTPRTTTTTPRPTATSPRPTTTNTRPTTTITRITTTTPTPTTTTPTTTSVTTTTTQTPSPTTEPTTVFRNSRETTILDRASDLPDFTVNTWTMDYAVTMWVLKLQDGTFMFSKPGQTPKKATRDEFIKIRRGILAQATTTVAPTVRQQNRQSPQQNRRNEMEADAPLAQSMTLNSNRGLNLENVREGGQSSRSQTILSGNNAGRNQGQTGSSVDTVLTGQPDQHRHRHGNHGNDAHHRRQKKVEIRVSGGRTSRDGRIEVLPPGEADWGVICGDFWTLKEAIVSCRHFGLGYAQQAAKTIHYGGKYQKKYYSSVRCHGSEKTLDECQWEDHNGLIQCTRSEAVAAIVCSQTLPDLEPSTYMVESSSYLRDLHMYYLVCAMEENCLAPSAYEIKRTSRQWRSSTRRLLRFSSVVKNIGTADFKPKSRRSDWEWHACHMHYHSMEVFAHYDIVDKNGNRMAEGLKASFCLEDSACDRGVFPKYDCQNYGEQGISVGCSDNYMADIDCQWIDITDLKPGNYFFKLEVNPSMMVPEISFDNNGMSCDLHYTGYYARITNCKLQSIL